MKMDSLPSRIFLIFNMTILLIFALSSFTFGNETLRGIKNILVKVAVLPSMERDGLKKARIKSQTEKRFHETGINAVTDENWPNTPGRPYILIEINGAKVQDNWQFYTYSITVRVFQDVVLVRDEKSGVFQASTWYYEHSNHGYIEDIMSKTNEIVQVFINDYKAVNTK